MRSTSWPPRQQPGLRCELRGAARQLEEKIMNTLVHLSHQGVLLAQMLVASIAMVGLGLEGMSAEQEIPVPQRVK